MKLSYLGMGAGVISLASFGAAAYGRFAYDQNIQNMSALLKQSISTYNKQPQNNKDNLILQDLIRKNIKKFELDLNKDVVEIKDKFNVKIPEAKIIVAHEPPKGNQVKRVITVISGWGDVNTNQYRPYEMLAEYVKKNANRLDIDLSSTVIIAVPNAYIHTINQFDKFIVRSPLRSLRQATSGEDPGGKNIVAAIASAIEKYGSNIQYNILSHSAGAPPADTAARVLQQSGLGNKVNVTYLSAMHGLPPFRTTPDVTLTSIHHQHDVITNNNRPRVFSNFLQPKEREITLTKDLTLKDSAQPLPMNFSGIWRKLVDKEPNTRLKMYHTLPELLTEADQTEFLSALRYGINRKSA